MPQILAREIPQLEPKLSHLAVLLLLLHEGLVKLIDDGDGEQDARSGSDCPHEIGNDRQGADAHPAERGGRGDVPIEDVNERRIAVALHDHLVVPKLLRHVSRRRARHLDPRLGEEGARRQDEDEVEDRVEGIVDDLGEAGGRGDVVRDAPDGDGLSALAVLPLAQNAHEDVRRGAVVQELADEVEVRHERGLQDDGHVARVKELDGVGPLLAAVLLVLDGEDDAPSLEVNDDGEDEDGGEEVGEVGKVLAVDGLLDRADLVVARDEEVEEGDDGALELGAAAGVDGGGAEGLPDDVLTLGSRVLEMLQGEGDDVMKRKLSQ